MMALLVNIDHGTPCLLPIPILGVVEILSGHACVLIFVPAAGIIAGIAVPLSIVIPGRDGMIGIFVGGTLPIIILIMMIIAITEGSLTGITVLHLTVVGSLHALIVVGSLPDSIAIVMGLSDIMIVVITPFLTLVLAVAFRMTVPPTTLLKPFLVPVLLLVICFNRL